MKPSLTQLLWIAGAAVAAVALALAALAFTAKGRADRAAAESHAQAVLATGHANGAAQAVGTVSDNAAATAATLETQRDNADAIRKAEGADQAVTGAVVGTARNRLCRYAAYSQSAECVQQAHTGALAHTR